MEGWTGWKEGLDLLKRKTLVRAVLQLVLHVPSWIMYSETDFSQKCQCRKNEFSKKYRQSKSEFSKKYQYRKNEFGTEYQCSKNGFSTK
jgi:hypothetical protein